MSRPSAACLFVAAGVGVLGCLTLSARPRVEVERLPVPAWTTLERIRTGDYCEVQSEPGTIFQAVYPVYDEPETPNLRLFGVRPQPQRRTDGVHLVDVRTGILRLMRPGERARPVIDARLSVRLAE